MAIVKFLQNVAGQITEVIAGITTSTGSADAGKLPALDDSGRLHVSFLPIGIGADTQIVVASEALAAGDNVNIWNDTGTPKVRKADATSSGKGANGFVLASVGSGGNAEVYFEGSNTAVSGKTAGKQYLATTAGLSSATPPTGTGNVIQIVGFATSATVVNFQSGTPIVLA